MTDKIGSIIKELRKKHNYTQDELAEQLNISSQAISKWENGTSLPDISQIVPLARVFGVTTDELFGIYGTNDDEEVEKLFQELHGIYMDENIDIDTVNDTILSKCLEGIKLFPKSLRLLSYALAYTASKAGELKGVDDPKADEMYQESLRQASIIINCSKDMSQILNAHMWLVRLYCDFKEFDKAKEEAENFPKEFECNAGLQYAWIYDSEHDREKETKTRCKNISDILQILESELWSLGLTYKQKGNYDEAIDTIETAIQIAERVYRSEEFIHPRHCDVNLYTHIAYCYIDKQDTENAISYLEKEYEFIKRAEKFYNKKTKLNVPCLKECEFKSRGTTYNGMESLVYDMEHPYCDGIRDNERFKALYDKATASKTP